MADPNTAQKAQLTVTDSNGADLLTNVNLSVNPAGIVDLQIQGDHYFAFGIAVGTATITATFLGSSGTLEVSVTEAPLTLTLGPAVPK
jgi:hypothetical protein